MLMQEKKVKGFSLLELLVVIAIVATISAISFTPFQKWRSDRIVRTEAMNLSSIIRDIFSQVQRGQYSFVQFEIIKDNAKYSVSSNGMKTTEFTDLVRNKYEGDTLKPFHKFETRCAMTDLEWDHQGSEDENVLTVNEIFIDLDDVELGVKDKSKIPDGGGKVCFSKDGTYYSSSGMFLEGTGDEAKPLEELYICSAKSSATSCTLTDDEPDQENFFKIEWSRFGNVSLKKWGNNDWILQ